MPEDRLSEFLYSGLLRDLQVLFANILAERGSWRVLETFLKNLSENVKLFNAMELQDSLLGQVFELLQTSCDSVKV